METPPAPHVRLVNDESDESTADTAGEPGRRERAQNRSRPQRPLPTDRIKIDRQPDVLAAFTRLSGANRRVVDGELLGDALGMHPATARLLNPFFHQAGFVERVSKGNYVATNESLEWERLRLHQPEMARNSLRSAMQGSWYWTTVEPLFASGEAQRGDLMALLLREAGAASHHSEMVENVLFWLDFVGLINIDGERITPAGVANVTEHEGDQNVSNQRPADTEVPKPTTTQADTSRPVVLRCSFSFSLEMTADDIAKLRPEQIASVFSGAGTLAAANTK